MRPILNINLKAIQDNYRYMQSICDSEVAACVKANCYGLGAKTIVPALYEAGCRKFFVATMQEGVEIANLLHDNNDLVKHKIYDYSSISIHVLNGFTVSEIPTFIKYNLIPIINTPEQLAIWPSDRGCVVHINTGMNRLGINCDDFAEITSLPSSTLFLMSHLACDGDANSPHNQEQLKRFLASVTAHPNIPRSLAASGGVFLGSQYHFDLARVGAALYGIGARVHKKLQNPVSLSAPIIQTRQCASEEYVGYGATKLVPKGTILATIPVGYADGFSRFFSNNGTVYVKNRSAEVVGRISMDLTIIDITGHDVSVGEYVELLGANIYPDDIAVKIGTIGYEILTLLKSGRFEKVC